MEQSAASSQAITGNSQSANVKLALGWLQSIIDAIEKGFGSSIRVLRDAISFDATLDIDVISTRLDVECRGEADGRQEQPSPTQVEVAGFQGEIVAHFRDLQRRAQRRAAVWTDKMSGFRKQIDLQEAVSGVQRISARCEDDILRLNTELQSRLQLLNERESRAQHHYAAFRERNGLDRVAEYSRSRYFYFAFMAALIGAATVAVGSVTASGSPDEALFSAAWAASFALTAVLVPFILGTTIFRSINHCGEFRRLAGWVGGAVAMAFIGALAFLVARYLQAKMADPGVAVATVADAILSAPIAIGAEAPIWTGFGIIGMAGVLGFLTGYQSDDPYPGYGSIQRTLYRARKDRSLLAKRLRKQVNTIVDKAGARVTASQRRQKAQVRKYARLMDQSERTRVRLTGYEAALEEACNIVVDRYRAANMSARTSSAPTSFSERVTLSSGGESNSSSIPDDERLRLEEFQRGIAELADTATQARQQLSQLNWRELAALEGGGLTEDSALHPEERSPTTG